MMKILEEIKQEILAENIGVELITVHGSYVFGKMEKYSDLDLEVFTKSKPKRKTKFKIVKHKGRPLLVSAYVHKFADVMQRIKDPSEWIWDYHSFNRSKSGGK